MKIAFFLDTASTGGWIYIQQLLSAMERLGEDVYLVISDNFSHSNDRYLKQFEEDRVLLTKPFFKKYKKRFENKFFDVAWNYLRRTRHKLLQILFMQKNFFKNKHKITTIDDFDVVFYPWPFTTPPHPNAKKVFFIPHDFIRTHFYGYSAVDTQRRIQQICDFIFPNLDEFFCRGTAIVSTPFIKKEAVKFLEDRKLIPKNDINIVYTAKFTQNEDFTEQIVSDTLKKYGINNCRYIHLANNSELHKNSGIMFSAMWYILQKYPDTKLVCTGIEDDLLLKVNNHIYADIIFDRDSSDWDIKTIGLLPHRDMCIVMKNALCVVNCSLCEAGAGSAMDAWELGVPMIMSDIPPFRDQLEFYRTKAELFDPRNSKSLADAVIRVLENPDLARRMVTTSQKVLQEYTWEDVAHQYINIFKQETHGITYK